jgi:polar amino acid transport system substrate-binding protein
VRADSIPASVKLFMDQKLDALAGLKPGLLQDVKKIPGARLLEGQFTAVQQSIGVPKKRAAAVRHLRAFVEEVKGAGVVARLIEEHGVKGVNVAPPAR